MNDNTPFPYAALLEGLQLQFADTVERLLQNRDAQQTLQHEAKHLTQHLHALRAQVTLLQHMRDVHTESAPSESAPST